MKLRISKPAIVLAVITLCVEVSLGCVVEYLLAEMKTQNDRLTRSIRLTNLLRVVTDYTSQRMLTFGIWKAVEVKAYYKRAERCSDIVEKNLAEFIELTENPEMRTPLTMELVKVAHQIHERGGQIAVNYQEGATVQAEFESIKLFRLIDKLYELADQVVEEAGKKQADLRLDILQKQKSLSYVTWTVVLFNLALILGSSVYFANSSRRNVAILADNASRLAASQPLLPVFGGDDQVVEIDRILRSLNKELLTLRTRERAVFENLSEVICSIDDAGKICDINLASTRLWQYERDELMGRRLASLFEGEHLEKLRNHLNQAFESGHSSFEGAVKRKDGTDCTCLFHISWSNAEKRFFFVAHDVSERKQLEKMKNEFVAMVSHDLRAPLTSVRMTFEMIDAGAYGALSDEGVSALLRAQRSVDRLINLVNGLLDLEKIESGSMKLLLEEIELYPIVDGAISSVKALSEEKSIQLITECAEGLTVYCDEERVIQVLVNLLSNAIKFSPANSTITISAELNSHGFVVFKVKDEGRGIAEDKIGLLFERFRQVRTEDSRGKAGIGLGLSICKEIVQLNRGEIGVDSVENRGSTFWFSLPSNVEAYESGGKRTV